MMNHSLKMSCKDFEENASAEYSRLRPIVFLFFYNLMIITYEYYCNKDRYQANCFVQGHF